MQPLSHSSIDFQVLEKEGCQHFYAANHLKHADLTSLFIEKNKENNKLYVGIEFKAEKAKKLQERLKSNHEIRIHKKEKQAAKYSTENIEHQRKLIKIAKHDQVITKAQATKILELIDGKFVYSKSSIMPLPSILPSQLDFNSEGFTSIFPFNKQSNPLKAGVQSDHMEISVKTAGAKVINIWNISNPRHHNLFKNGPFKDTHMYVEHPLSSEWLRAKEKNQIHTIAERFVRGEVNVQIMVEGYASFYQDLAERIAAFGYTDFKLISLLNCQLEDPTIDRIGPGNVTGILIDTARFSVLKSGVMSASYNEENNANAERKLYLPYAHIQDKITGQSMLVAGVHVGGCASQHPKSGLNLLAKKIIELKSTILGPVDVLAGGDFNSPPMYVRESAVNLLGPQGMLLKAPYPTHLNPNNQAGNYDHVLMFKADPTATYEILPASSLTLASQNLLSSIQQARQKFIEIDR